jgi:Gpi18-like mannosyltransferase
MAEFPKLLLSPNWKFSQQLKEKLPMEPNSPMAKWFAWEGMGFVLLMWGLSRLVVAIALVGIAPALPTPAGGVQPDFGWEVFSRWDSLLYKQIVTLGYEYADDGKGHLVAFFPLLPLLIRGLMNLGLSFEVAGTLLNHGVFLGALMVLYRWVAEIRGRSAARWATAVLAWFPASLFSSVIYTEALFLLFTTAALRAFDRQRYGQTALWGAIATATRPTGLALIPALLLTAWQQRRPAIAYLASLATAAGVGLFSLYCQFRFGDALAFWKAQKGWDREVGVPWQGWFKILTQITVGSVDWVNGVVKDPWHPVFFSLILGVGYLLWKTRDKLGPVNLGYGMCLLSVLLWVLGGDPFLNAIAVFGSLALLWYLRADLPPIVWIYGFCGLALILVSGSTWSLSRIAYGIVSPTIAFGVLLSYHPRWGYAAIGFCALLLILFAVRFAQGLWIG